MSSKKITISDYYYKKAEIDTMMNGKADSSSLSTVATSGSYTDLSNKPSTFPPSNHTHLSSDVTDFDLDSIEDNLRYEVLCFTDNTLSTECYNFDIDSTVYIIVNAFNVYGDSVSVGSSEVLTVNTVSGVSSLSGSQRVTYNGVETNLYVYSASEWGQCRFSIKTYDTFINIANPYPVGSIYMSVNSTNPSTLFGGTWEQLKDRFLLGSGDTYNNGATGGSATVKLTANQSGLRSHGHGMTHTHSHHHSLSRFSSGQGSGDAYTQSPNRTLTSRDTTTDATASSKSTTDSNTALDAKEAHNNMPPYLVVYMWKRTA